MHWLLHPPAPQLQFELASSLNISPITAQVLINRGMQDMKSAHEFLHPSLQHLADPFTIPDMDKAVSLLIDAIRGRRPITIYGDYDTDGVSSTALLIRFFRSVGVEADYYIPHRIREGYGMSKGAIDLLKQRGTELIITVDNGICAFEEIEHAKRLGIDVIVTDHHETKGGLPDAAAIVNPKRPDSEFPHRDLAGVGVAFNLLMALRQRMRQLAMFKDAEPNLRSLLDLVTLGTVADGVPLVGENRLLVKFGLEELKRSPNRGINALKIVSGLEPHQISTHTVAFRLAPRINAAGRLSDAACAVELLTTDAPETATDIAVKLDKANSTRQQIEARILKEAATMIKDEGKNGAIVLSGDNWHVGVIGIVATRIAESHGRPTAVISLEGDRCRGSARAPASFSVIDALSNVSDLLINYGGHRHAAGLTIERSQIESFKRRFAEITADWVGEEESNTYIDAEIEVSKLTEQLIKELELLAPFGKGNPEPVFSCRELKVAHAGVVGTNHLKLKVTDDVITLDAIGFEMGDQLNELNDFMDVAFIPRRDTWRGFESVQLNIVDIKTITNDQ